MCKSFLCVCCVCVHVHVQIHAFICVCLGGRGGQGEGKVGGGGYVSHYLHQQSQEVYQTCDWVNLGFFPHSVALRLNLIN